MSFTPATLPNGKPVNERLTLAMLAAVQFTHVLDFMVMTPLGPYLMDVFSINPAQFGRLVAIYGLAAALSGLAGGAFLDRLNRKRAMLACYAGFCAATLACALAPGPGALMAARFIAGACGGLSSSLVVAMVADFIPPERRGRAMAVVAVAFPVAQVLGLPLGLVLAEHFGWHATFLLIFGASVPVLLLGARVLPSIRPPAGAGAALGPLAQMRAILTHPLHLRGFWLTASLVLAGGSIFPFIAPHMVANVGIPRASIVWLYLVTGAVQFFTTPLVGRLVDRHNKVRLLGVFTLGSLAAVFTLTNLPPVPLPLAILASTAFGIAMSSRFPPAMTMLTNAVGARYRGGFMSMNFAIQNLAGAIANMTAGALITERADGTLAGFPLAGLFAAFWVCATYFLARRVAALAPHAALPGRPPAGADAGGE
ncbi:MAG: MFS transporter [Opitutaceae bacterium]|jgi:predicted MFS family arabinose efflux permease|nr:MFS transporter [Opitutaceae bacterium]